jgi:hypothetical protein
VTTPSDPWGVPAPATSDPWSVPAPGLIPPDSTPPAMTPSAGSPAEGPVIVRIAEMAITSTTVHTPTGDIPLAGSKWQVTDYWMTQQRIPRWAIVAAIAGFCVLTVFSLLFLLVKESVMQGTVQVTVTNGTRQYVARIPVTDQAAVSAINQQVNYVRTLAAL